MSTFTFDPTAFRLAFPQFASETTYPDSTLLMNWDSSGCIVQNSKNACFALSGDCRFRALNLLTAHLLVLSISINAGKTPGLTQAATIDKVSVSLTPPPLKSQFQWWLSQTGYGQQLLIVLQVAGVGGFSIGGLPELAAIRRVGGVFCP